MNYYDEKGNFIDDEDLLFQMLIPSSDESDRIDDIIIDFNNVKFIYDLLVEDEENLAENIVLDINDELFSANNYRKKLELWKKYKQSPLLELKISFEDRKTKAHVNIFPNKYQIEKYLEYASKWVHEKLKNKREDIFIYTLDDYKSDYEKKYWNLENLEKEIQRVRENIKSTVVKYNLNNRLNDYSSYFNDLTIDISFFKLRDENKIENLWGIAIGIGLLYGSYQYLYFLNSKKRSLDKIPRYKLADNLSYYSDYTDKELESIYNQLVDKGYIDKMEILDFINIFREKNIKDIRPIIWKNTSSRWLCILTLLELLVKPDYTNIKQFRITLGFCFCFEKDSNIIEDIGKSLGKPLDKIKNKHYLQIDIKKIVESDKQSI